MTPSNHPHAIAISPNRHRVRVTFNETVIADSDKAIVLKEGPLPPVLYLPMEDVMMTYLNPTTHTTHCPFKGDASYFTISVGEKTAENAVWSYASPLPAVAGIKEYLAFYPEKMDAIDELPAGD
jgi:uncharacterized protein (DUF427 family)